MPLNDGYQTEKDLVRTADELASDITEYFTDREVNDKRAFILFVCDIPTGVVHYISDVDPDIANQVMASWLKSKIKPEEPDRT